ncbi:MAG: MBL fold metallo-hydrolase [Kiritimatiellae bacterium]|nr:MBL fold metallo-hydrolase [Kiritimatiellia bacterium]
MKRLSALWIVLFLLALCMSACDSDAPSADTTADLVSTTVAPATEPSITELAIVKNGVANFRVIRGEDATKAAIDAAALIRSQIGETTGVYLDMSTDWVKRGTEHDHESLEILVGPTGYSESTDALQDIPYGDYVITRINNKLVINAWSEQGLSAAVSALTRELWRSGGLNNFTLPADIHITGTTLEIINHIPYYNGGRLDAVYHAGDNNQVLIIEDTNSDEYAVYRETLASAGYTLYAENDITDNRFATYINDNYVINAGYYGYDNEVRIIIEPRTTLPALESENKYEKIVEPSFAMLGLEYMNGDELTQNGLCLIWQLADGSYIVADGGLNRARDAKALYDYMYQHAPDPNNITIAAWFITHSHGDHDGAFRKFSTSYASKVKLEMLIGNFPSQEARDEGGISTEGGSGPQTMKCVQSYKDAEFVKAHVGQEYFLRDAKVEILYTLESFAPGVLTYFNTSSLIFTVEIGGQRFLIPGDASNNACTIASKMYTDYLKSDFIHAAHHGYNTGSDSSGYSGVTKFYSLSAAPVVLWPIGDQNYHASMHTRAYSAHLQNLASTKEIIVAGSREFRITLPYTYGTSGQKTILK